MNFKKSAVLFLMILALASITFAADEQKDPESQPWVTAANGKALPKDGGEPGKVFASYDKAFMAGDIATLKTVAPTLADQMEKTKKESADQFQKMLGMVKMMRASDIKITGGFSNKDKATLMITGMGSMSKKPLNGNVNLSMKGTSWIVEKENWDTEKITN